MLEKYFYTHENKYNTAGKFGLRFEFRAENVAYLHAYRGKRERDNADKRYRKPYVYVGHKAEGYTNGKRIYARGNRHRYHGFHAEGITALLFFAANGFAYHIAADNGKKHESYPVVKPCYIGFKLFAKEISAQRHKPLKSTEIKADDKHVAPSAP